MEILADGGVTSALGFSAGGTIAGIKPSGALDFGLLVSDQPAVSAAVFTQHAAPSACVIFNREQAKSGTTRALIVNSGNANAATGAQGLANAREMAALASERTGIPVDQIMVCSTGVIGVQLPMDLLRQATPRIPLASDGGAVFAGAIMTTDTHSKQIAVQVELEGRTITIGGCAKGAGMIHPNMATMLAFITTDAPATHGWLEGALKRCVADTFNMIDIDSDTSTNDTVLIMANGAAGGPVISGGSDAEAVEAGLKAVCEHLATEIVRDAEGGTKLITVDVTGAPDSESARKVARIIAGSLMVKTAVHGNDPNWGRIVGAAGNAGVPIDLETTTIAVGDIVVFRHGEPHPFDHASAVTHLAGASVRLLMDLGAGAGTARAWGCNMSEAYVTLNSVYTT